LSDKIKDAARLDPGGQQVWNDPGCIIVACAGEPRRPLGEERLVVVPNESPALRSVLTDLEDRITSAFEGTDPILIPSLKEEVPGPRPLPSSFQSYEESTNIQVLHALQQYTLNTPVYDSVPLGHLHADGLGEMGAVLHSNPIPLLEGSPRDDLAPHTLSEETFGPFLGVSASSPESFGERIIALWRRLWG
jgi:hypothetical protein